MNGVVDTNGAGDSFATGWMLAAAAGHPDPTVVANWAGVMGPHLSGLLARSAPLLFCCI